MTSLAFEHADGSFWVADKLGILLDSAPSAAVGAGILAISLPSREMRNRDAL